MTPLQWEELIDELEGEGELGMSVIEAWFVLQLDDDSYRVTLSVEAPKTGRIYRLDCTLERDGVSLNDTFAQPEELAD